MTQETCTIIGKVFAFLGTPGGEERLSAFLEDREQIITTEQASDLTQWSTDHILRLCRQKRLPHIPGKPHLFVYSDLMRAIRQMQIGGEFGRRKSAQKMKMR